MRLPVPIVVAGILLREILRALATPFWVVAFLATRERWCRAASETLAKLPDASEPAWSLPALRSGTQPPHLFVSAGEASGEMHAVKLVRGVRARHADVRVTCFGGKALESSGARLLWPLADHAVMGLTAALASLPFFLRAVGRFVRLVREDRPDLVVLVDYPGLHLVLAEICKRAGVPVVHYVAPQYWAWGPWRMRRYARAFTGTLTILPFEPAWFTRFAIASRYVGHPLLDQIAEQPPHRELVAKIAKQPVLVLLAGSRTKEIRSHLPGMLEVAAQLRSEEPVLRVVVAQRDPRKAELARALIAAAPGDARTWAEVHQGEVQDYLTAARLVIAKSGTGSLESVLRGAPTIVVYRVGSALAKALYSRLVMLPFFASANLVAGRLVVEEIGFSANTGWPSVLAAARSLLHDGPARSAALLGAAEVALRLGPPGASERAAACIADAFVPKGLPR